MPRLSPPDAPFASLPTDVAAVRSALASVTRRQLSFFGFWTGVLAPLAYPLFLLGDLDSRSLLLLLGVVCLNVVGLLLGRDYADRS